MTDQSRWRRSWRRILLWVVIGLIVLFGLIQLVPYGRSHDNPAVTNAFVWKDAAAEKIARQSCYDCHSNETTWWWATNIAPFSWLVQSDVDGGREHLNFSEWHGGPPATELQDAVNHGMPPFQYTLLHPGAKLSDAEKQTLVDGYAKSVAGDQGGGSSQPGGTQGDSSTQPSGSSDAVAVINARCGSCHPAQQAVNYHASSADQAAQLIDRMVQRGATVTAAERQTLIRYFTG